MQIRKCSRQPRSPEDRTNSRYRESHSDGATTRGHFAESPEADHERANRLPLETNARRLRNSRLRCETPASPSNESAAAHARRGDAQGGDCPVQSIQAIFG